MHNTIKLRAHKVSAYLVYSYRHRKHEIFKNVALELLSSILTEFADI